MRTVLFRHAYSPRLSITLKPMANLDRSIPRTCSTARLRDSRHHVYFQIRNMRNQDSYLLDVILCQLSSKLPAHPIISASDTAVSAGETRRRFRLAGVSAFRNSRLWDASDALLPVASLHVYLESLVKTSHGNAEHGIACCCSVSKTSSNARRNCKKTYCRRY